MLLTPEIIEAVRREYLAKELSVAQVAEVHGLALDDVYRLRRLYDWPPRDPTKVAAGRAGRWSTTHIGPRAAPVDAPSPPAPPDRPKTDTPMADRPVSDLPVRERLSPGIRPPVNPPATMPARVQKRRLIQRLYGAITRKLEQMETSMSGPEAANPADSERETRALGNLIKNYEKVQALETDLTRDAAAAGGKPGAMQSADDSERKRRELEARIRKVRERFERDDGGSE